MEKVVGGQNPLDPTTRHLRYWERQGHPLIFICYRSGVEDDVDLAHLLYDSASMSYGKESIFLASHSIPPATRFSPVINAALENSVLFVPIIGRDWAESLPSAAAKKGHPWVVHEVATALRMGKIILPVMAISDHRIRGDVPPELAEITEYQTINCSLEGDGDFVPRVEETVRRMAFLVPQLLDAPPLFNYLATQPPFAALDPN